MEKEFIVFYIHEVYGAKTMQIDSEDILSALDYFIENVSYEKVLGIMAKN